MRSAHAKSVAEAAVGAVVAIDAAADADVAEIVVVADVDATETVVVAVTETGIAVIAVVCFVFQVPVGGGRAHRSPPFAEASAVCSPFSLASHAW